MALNIQKIVTPEYSPTIFIMKYKKYTKTLTVYDKKRVRINGTLVIILDFFQVFLN
jgi:hypothetical protein